MGVSHTGRAGSKPIAEQPPRPIPQKLLRAAKDVREAAELTALGWYLLREFLRHNFNKRELRIVLAVLVETYSWEATAVWIPEDRVLPLLTGITSNNIPRALRRLVDLGVIERRNGEKATWELRILPDSKAWKIAALHKREDVDAARRELRRLNDDKQLKLNFRISADFVREFQDALFDAKLAEAARTDGNVSLKLSETPATAREGSENVSLKTSESGRLLSTSERPHALKSSGTPPASTGTGMTERLYTVISNEKQRSKQEILDRVIRAIGPQWATRRQRSYYGKFFNDPVFPHAEIVARARWTAALQMEAEGTTGLDNPPFALTKLYQDERDRLWQKRLQREEERKEAPRSELPLRCLQPMQANVRRNGKRNMPPSAR